MKVSDVMHRSVVTITENTPLKEAGRLIFTLGITGIPVVRGKKMVGAITEQVIFSRMHPTLQDLIEDYIHAKDFDVMSKNIHDLLEVSVKEVMQTQVLTISPDAPLMLAQSEMQMNKISRLPVIDDNNELVGIISQGDIFRAIFKEEMPRVEKERYAGFISRYYDQIIDWEKRFDREFPALFELFNEKNVKKILEIGSWTGKYLVGLAQRSSYSVLGLDSSPVLIKKAIEKITKLPKDVRKRANIVLNDYINIESLAKEKFDALISMGNHLPYNPLSLNNLFTNMSKVMSDKAIAVISLLNFEKILNSKNRLLNFSVNKMGSKEGKEMLSIEFFDRKDDSTLLHNVIIFDFDGINWVYKGITTMEVRNIKKEDLKKSLEKAGFKKIAFFGGIGDYQGQQEGQFLRSPFDSLQSDWLNVVAEK